MKIAVAMIVKNEEKFIQGCLDSLIGRVDEICIINTRNTDRTFDIIDSYESPNIHWKFSDTEFYSFAQSRYDSLCFAERWRPDWIIILDADERAHFGNLRRFLECYENNKKIGAFQVQIINPSKQFFSKDYVFESDYIRIIRAGKGIRYTRPVHETIIPSLMANGLKFEQIPPSIFLIVHLGYDYDEITFYEKLKRNMDLMEPYLRENPHDTNMWYLAGNQYRAMGMKDLAYGAYAKALEVVSLEQPLTEVQHARIMRFRSVYKKEKL